MLDLCDYRNKTISSGKVDDNYHTGFLDPLVLNVCSRRNGVRRSSRFLAIDSGVVRQAHVYDLHVWYQGPLWSIYPEFGDGCNWRKAVGYSS